MADRETAARGVESALLRLNRALNASAREDAGTGGLTPAQAETLRFCSRTRPDMATVGNLARVLGVRSATAVGIVQPLVARGLIARVAHPFDSRQQILEPTADGQEAVRALDAAAHRLSVAIETLNDVELAQLELGLGALARSLQQLGVLVVAAPCAGCVHFEPNAAPGEAAPHHCRLIRRYLSEAASRMECPEHQPAAASL